MNNWSFTGHLGKDAEVKQGQNGNRLVFSVAVQSGFGDKAKTTWANCVVFGKRADGALVNHLKVGTKVAISGEATLEKWTNSQGIEQQALKVVVNELDLIGSGAQNQNQAPQNGYGSSQAPQQQQNYQQQAPQSAPQPANNAYDSFEDSDLPF
jgi:single-strand DNA-binding protein